MREVIITVVCLALLVFVGMVSAAITLASSTPFQDRGIITHTCTCARDDDQMSPRPTSSEAKQTVSAQLLPKPLWLPDACFDWPEPEGVAVSTSGGGVTNAHESAAVAAGSGAEGLSFGPWSNSDGFPLFRDYQFPPHWTGAPPTLSADPTSTSWVLPGRYGLGSYELKRFVEDWTIIDTVMERYPAGPWPQFLGMRADRVAQAVRTRALALGMADVDVCILEDSTDVKEKSTCPIHTRCVVIHATAKGLVSRVPLTVA